jgi:hypothetical protein
MVFIFSSGRRQALPIYAKRGGFTSKDDYSTLKISENKAQQMP